MMRIMLMTVAMAALGCAVTTNRTRPDAEAQAKLEQLIVRDDQLAGDLERLQTHRSAFEQFRLDVQQHQLDSDYREFLLQHPTDVRALNAYAGFLYDQRRFDDAVRLWEQIIARPPAAQTDRRTLALAYNNLANHLGHEGGAATALRYYDKAIELDPTDAAFYFNWATTCFMMRNEVREVYGWDTAEIFRRSLERYRKARDLVPHDFEFMCAYAEAFYVIPNADWTAAYDGWRFCLNQPLTEDQREQVYSHLARVCLHLNRAAEARTWLDKIRPAGPTGPMRRILERRLAEAEK